MNLPIPKPLIDALASALTKLPMDLIKGVIELVGKIAASPDPKDMLARIAQVTAHDKGADAVLDAAFAAKRKVTKP